LKGFKPQEGVAFLEEREIGGDLQSFVEQVDGHPLLLRLVADLLEEEYPENPNLDQLSDLGLGNLQELLSDSRVIPI